MSKVTEQAVIDALRMVMEPELHKDLITLNMVKDLKIEEGTVKFTVVLTTPACPLKTEIKASCDKAVGAIPGVTKVEVDFTANVQQGRSQIKDNLIPTVKNTDRKSTRLNSSHLVISYAVFCLKKKKTCKQQH